MKTSQPNNHKPSNGFQKVPESFNLYDVLNRFTILLVSKILFQNFYLFSNIPYLGIFSSLALFYTTHNMYLLSDVKLASYASWLYMLTPYTQLANRYREKPKQAFAIGPFSRN